MEPWNERMNALETALAETNRTVERLEARERLGVRRLRLWAGAAAFFALLFVLALPLTPASAALTLEQRVAALESKLVYLTRSGTDMIISGANLHIVNGTGKTETSNSRGNLIVGYNETRNDGTDFRTGSHRIIVGRYNSYDGFGGLVVGQYNQAQQGYSSVLGGQKNQATAYYSTVTGGYGNIVYGEAAMVCGGTKNTASNLFSSILGGKENDSSGEASTVSGGESNVTTGDYSSVSGGYVNRADGLASAVSGGSYNIASYQSTTVSGGYKNTASFTFSTVSGGSGRSSTAYASWRGGDLTQDH
jgi:hypothetical protein